MKTDSLFDGKYRILKLLGSGGSGKVYLAENIRAKSLWAIKEIRAGEGGGSLSEAGGAAVQVEREIEILKSIRHPALPRIIDVVREHGAIYLVEDYFEGANINDILTEKGAVEAETAVKWALSICDIMIYLHGRAGGPVIYRDIKPSNIILSAEGVIRLVDFGSVRQYKNGSPSDTVYIGTRGYAAPEQYGFGQTTVRSDVYSFGMTMLHIVTGIRPADADYGAVRADGANAAGANAKFANAVPYPIDKILEKCIKINPSERYASFNEIKTDLKKYKGAAGRPPHMRVPAANRPAGQPRRQACVPKPLGIYRCATVSVISNHEFTFELAFRLEEKHGVRTFILDFDFESGASEWYFKSGAAEQAGDFDNCLRRPVGLIEKSESAGFADASETCLSHNLSLRSGPLWLNEPDPEYSIEVERKLSLNHGGVLRRLLSEISLLAKVCLIVTNRSVFNALTAYCFQNSHIVIYPGGADAPAIRTFRRTSELAERLGCATVDRFKYVLWDCPYSAVDEELTRELPPGCLAGAVRPSRRRDDVCRISAKNRCYAYSMENRIKKDYDDIISALGLITG